MRRDEVSEKELEGCKEEGVGGNVKGVQWKGDGIPGTHRSSFTGSRLLIQGTTIMEELVVLFAAVFRINAAEVSGMREFVAIEFADPLLMSFVLLLPDWFVRWNIDQSMI